MNNTTAKAEKARLIHEKIEQGQRERERERKNRVCFERSTAVFDIDESCYRWSLELWRRWEARKQNETGSVSNDERVVICKNRRPITISRSRADVCQLACRSEEERRRGCVLPYRVARQRVSANGKVASLSRTAVTTRFVGWHPERTRKASEGTSECIVSNCISRRPCSSAIASNERESYDRALLPRRETLHNRRGNHLPLIRVCQRKPLLAGFYQFFSLAALRARFAHEKLGLRANNSCKRTYNINAIGIVVDLIKLKGSLPSANRRLARVMAKILKKYNVCLVFQRYGNGRAEWSMRILQDGIEIGPFENSLIRSWTVN